MSTFNYQEVSGHLKQHLNFNGSEKLALDNGFAVVLDSSAYNGRYFIKNHKKWIHNIKALKAQLGGVDDFVLEEMGYDVDTYYQTH